MPRIPKSAVLKLRDPSAPTEPELLAIVRGADVLVMRGGLRLLSLVLAGSRSKEIAARGLEKLPVFGALRGRTLREIRRRLEWAVRAGFLQLRFSGAKTLLALGPDGWELDRAIYVEEILKDFEQKLLEPHQLGDYMYLQEIHPEILEQLLDEVRSRDLSHLAPVLRNWKGFAATKIQRRIERVLAALEPKT
ncbi:MAG: hypothetical protein L0216_21285 [Planctomycetales bacterium]|nr:hypothetical protein [Planctomycetales bacterium]